LNGGTTEPHDELVNKGNYCLAKRGEIYAVYLPQGGGVTVQMEPGSVRRHVVESYDRRKKPLFPSSMCNGIFVEFTGGDGR